MSIDLVVGACQHADWSRNAAGDRSYCGRTQRFVLWFGACAPTQVLVYADNLEDALEDAAQEIDDRGWKGLFTEPDYEDAFRDLQRDGKIPAGITMEDIRTCDKYSELVLQAAEEDLTYTESGYIASWEWGVVAEDPSREELLKIAHSECYAWHGAMCHQHPMREHRIREGAAQ